ncbi:unnamed protein product [Closterium sp. Naga37s-1]|nr:unnamed protein product [Closterium sp. Naga37s-1]
MRALVVAGTHGGVGCTWFTLGLLAALRRRGLTVQPLRLGPEPLDAGPYVAACGREPINLDAWMAPGDLTRALFNRRAAGADVAVVEAAGGVFDGWDGGRADGTGSAAEMAKLLGGLPVLLLLDGRSAVRSAAALIHGFTSFDPSLTFAGMLLNMVESEAHAQWMWDALSAADVRLPLIGALPFLPHLSLSAILSSPSSPTHSPPSSLLSSPLPDSLSSASSPPVSPGPSPHLFSALADAVSHYVHIPRLLSACASILLPPPSFPLSSPGGAGGRRKVVRMGVARDAAFCLVYQENLLLLQEAGAELVFFSPLVDPLPPRLNAVYLPGGRLAPFAPRLSANRQLRFGLRAFAAAGGLVLAESAGTVFLAHSLQGTDGAEYPMCALLPFTARELHAPPAPSYCLVRPSLGSPLFDPTLAPIRGCLVAVAEFTPLRNHPAPPPAPPQLQRPDLNGLCRAPHSLASPLPHPPVPPSPAQPHSFPTELAFPSAVRRPLPARFPPGDAKDPLAGAAGAAGADGLGAVRREGVVVGGAVASQLHLCFASNPCAAPAVIQHAL